MSIEAKATILGLTASLCLLGATFGCEVGLLGGGEHSILPLTVSTYDSAYLHMDRIGNPIFADCQFQQGDVVRVILGNQNGEIAAHTRKLPERKSGRQVGLFPPN